MKCTSIGRNFVGESEGAKKQQSQIPQTFYKCHNKLSQILVGPQAARSNLPWHTLTEYAIC